jgi:hypothetical protein
MNTTRRRTMKKSQTNWRNRDEPLPPPRVSKLRIDFDDPDVSPQLVRGLLAKYGRVGDVTVYSGVHDGEDFCYAVGEMENADAEDAIDGLNGMRWRGSSLMAIFAQRGLGRTWLPQHDWKPPRKREDDDEE